MNPRFVYIKTGNAPEELQALGPCPDCDSGQGGPFQYTAGFLTATAGQPRLLLSLGLVSGRHEHGQVRAQSMRYVGAGRAVKIGSLLRVLRTLLLTRPRAVVCSMYGPALWTAWLAARLTGSRLIFSCHSVLKTGRENFFGRCRLRLDHAVIRRARAVLCNGRFLTSQAEAVGVAPDRLSTFFAVFTPDPGTPPPADIPPAPYILFAGRMVEDKGVFELLEAAEPILNDHAALRLVLAGDGPVLEPLRDEIRKRGLEGKALLPGKVDYDRMLHLFRGCIFTVAPTRPELNEGRSKAVVESLVCGKPVIATDMPTFRQDVRPDANGLFFPPKDVAALESAIRSLVEDESLLARLTMEAVRSGPEAASPGRTYFQVLHAALASKD